MSCETEFLLLLHVFFGLSRAVSPDALVSGDMSSCAQAFKVAADRDSSGELRQAIHQGTEARVEIYRNARQ